MLQSRRILFVYQASIGLRHDTVVLAKALSAAIPGAQFHSFEWPNGAEADIDKEVPIPRWIHDLMPLDLIVFLEHLVHCPLLFSQECCSLRVFIPNQEWITPNDQIALTRFPLDAILYKNKAVEEIAESLAGIAAIPVRRLVGWTSTDIAEQAGAAPDFSRFLHVRGVSVQKQTDVVIDTWLANPEFPPLTVVARMRENFNVPVPMRAAPNLEILMYRLEAARLRTLQRDHGVHICPSLVEGFGHSLNEARACGAVLVTNAGPPMADFVTPGVSGLLVPFEEHLVHPIRLAKAYPITPRALGDVVRTIMAMPASERSAMGAAARAHYLRDKAAFEAAMAALFEPSGVLALSR